LTKKLTALLFDLSYKMAVSILSVALYSICAIGAMIMLAEIMDLWLYGVVTIGGFSILLFLLFLLFGKAWIQRPVIKSLLQSFRS